MTDCTPVTVVSPGVKSILNIGLTLEYVEMQGVCVATQGSDMYLLIQLWLNYE